MLEDKIRVDEKLSNRLWVHLYNGDKFLRKFVLGYISEDGTTIEMQKKVKDTRGEDQKYHKNDGFAFNRKFLEKAEKNGIYTIKLKVDLLDEGLRKVYNVPIDDILTKGQYIHHKNCEAQVSIRSAYLIEHFAYHQELDVNGKVIRKTKT